MDVQHLLCETVSWTNLYFQDADFLSLNTGTISDSLRGEWECGFCKMLFNFKGTDNGNTLQAH